MNLRPSAFLWLSILFGNNAIAADNPTQEIDSLTSQWSGLEHQQDELRSNWRQEQPVLEQQISLLRREQLELTALLEKNAQAKDQVEQRRFELLEQQTNFEQEQTLLERELDIALIQIQEISKQLPPPLQDAWQEQMPKLLADEATVSDRLSILLEMLSQQDDFQRKITLNRTVITLSDGNSYLVDQVYLGLSHGWLVTADGSIAMSGQAGINGWQWQASEETVEISNIIAILQRQKTAELTSVSLTLSNIGEK